MQAMKRGEGHMGDAERGRVCGWYREGNDVELTMVLIEDIIVDDVVDNIDKMYACDAPTHPTNMDKKSTKPTTRTLQQQLQPWQSQKNNQG